MKILSYNVNGLRSSLKDPAFLAAVLAERPDVVCFQDTRTVEACAELDGFHAEWSHSQKKKGYAGTAVFTRAEPVRVVRDLPGDPVGSSEGRLTAVDLGRFWVVNTYVPNSGERLQRLAYRVGTWDNRLREFIRGLRKPVVWAGDMNVSLLDADVHAPEKMRGEAGFTFPERDSFAKTLDDLAMVDVFRHFSPGATGEYTFWSYRTHARAHNRGQRLDYFVVSDIGSVSSYRAVRTFDYRWSDHCPLVLSVRA